MESSERIKQDGCDDAIPHCFKGYRNGNAAGDTIYRSHRNPQDSSSQSLSPQESAADAPADAGEHCSDTLNLDGLDTGRDSEQAGEFGAPNEKIAALRKVLDEMKAKDGDAPEAESIKVRAPEPAKPEVNRAEHHHESSASLFRGSNHLTDFDATGERETVPVVFTIADLRRSHMNRAKRHESAMHRRNKSSSLLTGMVLVSAVTATMVGLYVMHPQIITAQPQLAPALNEYVETVDRYRAVGEQRSAEWQEWLSERIGNLTKAQK